MKTWKNAKGKPANKKPQGNKVTDARQILETRRAKNKIFQNITRAQQRPVGSVHNRLGKNFKRNNTFAPKNNNVVRRGRGIVNNLLSRQAAIVNQLLSQQGAMTIQRTITNDRFLSAAATARNTPKFNNSKNLQFQRQGFINKPLFTRQNKPNSLRYKASRQEQQAFQLQQHQEQQQAVPRVFSPNLGVSSRLGMPIAVTMPVRQNHIVMVTNLHPNVSKEDVNELFGDIGSVLSVSMTHPGSASVVYKTREEANLACKTYHNRHLDGMPMQCTIAQSAPRITDRLGPRIPTSISSHSTFAVPDEMMLIG